MRISQSASCLGELLEWAVTELKAAGVDTPHLDARILLAEAVNLPTKDIYAHPEIIPSSEAIQQFYEWVRRRRHREPLPYIIGKKEFYGLSFEISSSVLIPRPETEVLVETSIRLLKGVPNPTIADIGVGSGAIALSLAYHLKDATIYCTEKSADALKIARRNAARLNVGHKVHFLEGDLLKPLTGKTFDLIVSNPPYIPTTEIDTLQPEITKYEPRQALDGGPDGLLYYRIIVPQSPNYLKNGGWLAVEVGAGQATEVVSLFQIEGFKDIHTVADLAGIERVVVGRLK
jgi:release factor glutamine methyltransferase